jgi:hypothetical protein
MVSVKFESPEKNMSQTLSNRNPRDSLLEETDPIFHVVPVLLSGLREIDSSLWVL